MADNIFETISQTVGEVATGLVGGVKPPQEAPTPSDRELALGSFVTAPPTSPATIITGDEARTKAQEDLAELAEIQAPTGMIVPPAEVPAEAPPEAPPEIPEVEGEVISERDKIVEDVSKTLGRQVLPGEQIVRTVQETGLSLEEQLARAKEVFEEEGLTRNLFPGEISEIERGGFNENTLRLRAKRELGLPTAAFQAQILGTEELTAANSQIDTETDEALGIIDQTRAFIQASALRVIEGIQTSYNKRRRQMKEINEATLARQTIAGIRAGRQRFAPEIQIGILSAEEKDGIERLADLDAEEASLIMQAQDAATLKDFALLSQRLELVRDARKEKTDLLIELQKLAIEQDKALREQLKFQMDLQKLPLDLAIKGLNLEKLTTEQQERIAEIVAPTLFNLLGEDVEENQETIRQFAELQGIPFESLFKEIQEFQEAEGIKEFDVVKRGLDLLKLQMGIELDQANAQKIQAQIGKLNLETQKLITDIQNKLTGDLKTKIDELPVGQRDAAFSAIQTIKNADDLLKLLEDEKLDTGPFVKRIIKGVSLPIIGQIISGTERLGAISEKQAQFMALSTSFAAGFIKSISGVAVSEKEFERLMNALPDIGKQQELNKTTIKSLIGTIKNKYELQLGIDFDDFPGEIPKLDEPSMEDDFNQHITE